MKNFFIKVKTRLDKKYDNKTSKALANKLTKMFHQLNYLQSIPENEKTINMIQEYDDFHVVRRIVENIFDNQVFGQFNSENN
jgi:hypothetical protein